MRVMKPTRQFRSPAFWPALIGAVNFFAIYAVMQAGSLVALSLGRLEEHTLFVLGFLLGFPAGGLSFYLLVYRPMRRSRDANAQLVNDAMRFADGVMERLRAQQRPEGDEWKDA